MMQLQRRTQILAALGRQLKERPAALQTVVERACTHNPWFTPQSVWQAIDAITANYLNEAELHQWISGYKIQHLPQTVKTIGLVMAGNIPMVGFHDFLCVFISGHRAQVKLSAKDNQLFPFIASLLKQIDAEFHQHLEITEQLKGFDAVIATGSNNSARYFEHYFGKYPHIIRKNRNSVAILTGNETPADIDLLGKDIFDYYGLGCRNVSKLMVPQNYSFPYLLSHLEHYAGIMQHHKYKNNYDYYRSVYLLNRQPHFASDFLILIENSALASPVSVVHYEYYTGENDLNNQLMNQQEQIQCVVAAPKPGSSFVPFGSAQQPRLWDYADHTDTLQFLLEL